MQKYHLISLYVLASAFTVVVTSVLEDKAKEQACFPITKTVPIDVQWFSSLKRLYYPLMSKLDLYRVTRDIMGNSSDDITDPELYYNSCMYFELDPKNLIMEGHGYGGNVHQYKFKSFDPNMEKIEFHSISPKSDDGYSVTCYSTQTDNKTYTLQACCANDNQMFWTVSSAMKFLPKETIKEIHEHVTSLGFKKEYFTAFRYESCPNYEKI